MEEISVQRAASLLAIAAGLVGCSSTAPARAQLVVVIDTDAHLVGELASRPEVSPDAAIDSLRVEALDASNNVYATNRFAVADASRWPISFGVVPTSNPATEVHLRIRAFRASLAGPGTEIGMATLDPPAEATIDRLAWIRIPATGVTRVRVVLTEDCMGASPSFRSPTTCVDGARLDADPHDGVSVLSGAAPPTVAGSWAPAVAQPCTAKASGDPICIPGGFALLGDYAAVGANPVYDAVDPVPLRPVVVRPFLLDRTEFTVGKLRLLALAGQLDGAAMPASPAADFNAQCTWLGLSNMAHDAWPVNCVPYATAKLACQLSGGSLPTEAQWEYAATGRGEHRRYPWGNEDPVCCGVDISRGTECSDGGPDLAGSHTPTALCSPGDESKDGVLDLAGSLSEAMLDDLEPYTDPCWDLRRGILHDPICVADGGAEPAGRGANWSTGRATAWLVLRQGYHQSDTGTEFEGFRCAYSGAAP